MLQTENRIRTRGKVRMSFESLQLISVHEIPNKQQRHPTHHLPRRDFFHQFGFSWVVELESHGFKLLGHNQFPFTEIN